MGKRKMVIERQVIVTWYEPWEDVPEEGEIVVATISGKRGNVRYENTLALVEWWKGTGWVMSEDSIKMDEFVVHAWCDLEPYGGG